MNQAMSQERMEQIFDQVTREVTQRTAGVCLHGGGSPSGELCTVYTTFQKGCWVGLSMCAERSLFARLAQGMLPGGQVSERDMEDFTKEYFNVLCGRIISEMYLETKAASRFEQPVFCVGRRVPQGHQEHFSLRYTSDCAESAELVYQMRDSAACTLPR